MTKEEEAHIRYIVKEVIKCDEEAHIRAIVKEVIKCERETRERDEFYIKRKDLYDTHRRTNVILGAIDHIAGVIGKTVVYSFLVAVAAAVIWFLGRIK